MNMDHLSIFEDFTISEPSESAAETADRQAQLDEQLARSRQLIDRQASQISRLNEALDRMETEAAAAQEKIKRTRRCWRITAKAAILVPCLTGALIFHREVCQVGWNMFHFVTAPLQSPPEYFLGFLTAAAVGWTLWKLLLATCRAAAEDLFASGGEGLFLSDEEE